nr:phospholipase-like protein [Tanacetum cinerariifolium]
MDDSIPHFLRRVFPDKEKNLENKASLGKATKGKVAKDKAAKGKGAKVNMQNLKLHKPYDCKVTIRSRPSTIPFNKERLSKSNKRLKLFKDTVFGKYLDFDVEDNDNHLLNYVLHHQRPQLSKSIDSNLVFNIAGHTLLFGRSEFFLVTGFVCGKLVFPEYMDDSIPH